MGSGVSGRRMEDVMGLIWQIYSIKRPRGKSMNSSSGDFELRPEGIRGL
jgi:hypothetical protein